MHVARHAALAGQAEGLHFRVRVFDSVYLSYSFARPCDLVDEVREAAFSFILDVGMLVQDNA